MDISRFHRTLLNRITEGDRPSDGGADGGKEEAEDASKAGSENSRSDMERGQSPVEVGGQSPEGQGSNEGQSPRVPSQDKPEGGEMSDEGQEARTLTTEGDVDSSKESGGGGLVVDTVSLFPPTVDKAQMRKVAAAKRANEETTLSAKERYLARKRAKLTAPIITDD